MKYLSLLLTLCFASTLIAQIPDDKILKNEDLPSYLKEKIRKEIGEDESKLAAYLKQQFSQRFFYDYNRFEERFHHYDNLYDNAEDHKKRALDHLAKYPAAAQWKLPFNYQNGDPVNAYALRHLARQHKMVDIAFLYFNEGKDPKYIQYFVQQMKSLNVAFEVGEYDRIEDGNGVYEVFRSGYRILNWLSIHNMFLNEKAYSDKDQLQTIATLLQHGQHLYERNAKFKFGNHQTRGMSALAMLSILLRDFEGTQLWYDRAMLRLKEHLDKEINPDGFQFERSIHYHMSDINNYYFVYQLAKINGIQVEDSWEQKLRGLFTTLVKVAYPDRSAPVLQDDTEIPLAEKNDISGAMTLGYLLFEDPAFGYFAKDKVKYRMYWFLNQKQINLLADIGREKPTYGSLLFENTEYYIMREGWAENDKMMIVSAGVDEDKPDHQHGDILGIQAMANGQIILPNYQVRYPHKDFYLFKNSMVKNVALVDDELQGRKWTSNKGGSGFGKFKDLPNPETIAWKTTPDFDFYAGKHDGFERNGVTYTRQIIYIKDDFWVVKDDFQSEGNHTYKQVWQGHYTTEEGSDFLRSTFADASGLDILQMNATDSAITSGARGKNWTVVSKENQSNFHFLTFLFPYKKYNNRINENAKSPSIGDWELNNPLWQMEGTNATSLHHSDSHYFFNTIYLKSQDYEIQISETGDLFIKVSDNKIQIHSLGTKNVSLVVKGMGKKRTKELRPGEYWLIEL